LPTTVATNRPTRLGPDSEDPSADRPVERVMLVGGQGRPGVSADEDGASWEEEGSLRSR